MRFNMGIIKVEIKVEEAVKAVEEFRKDRRLAMVTLSQQVKTLAAHIVNQLLHTEMTLFLGKPEQSVNKRNGYKERQYALKGIGAITIRMPIDRRRQFSSEIIPSREQMDPRLKEDIAILHLAGISNRTLGMMSKRLLGVKISHQTVVNSMGSLKEKAMKFLERPINQKYWALFVDGTNFKVQRRGSTEREPALVILGLDEQNRMSIVAIEAGSKDNVECWRSVFDSAIKRGLQIEGVRLGIMDGLPGLEALFKETFHQAQTARCWVHAMKNALAKCPSRLREPFKKLIRTVMYANGQESARQAFMSLKEAMGADAGRAVSCLEKDLDSLLVHYGFDRRLWLSLKTTNAIERVNREFKRRYKSMDSIGEGSLNVLLAFTALRLEYNWQTKSVTSYQTEKLLGPNGCNIIESVVDELIH